MAFTKVFKTNSVTVVNECQAATVRRQIIKRKNYYYFVVKMCKNNNSVGAAVAVKYIVDEFEILKRLL